MKIIFETKEEYEDFIIDYLARNNKFILESFEPDFGNDVDICTVNFKMVNKEKIWT